MNSTYYLAQRLGGDAVLTDGTDKFVVSDWSPGAKRVYGWRIRSDGARGAYMELPADLKEYRP